VEDVAQNVRFIREHPKHPVNFCRAEPYYGTPLHLELAALQDLGGSYLGWNYRIEDDRAELLFRICSAAFRTRNFDPAGVANRYMGLGYAANVLRQFHPSRDGARERLQARTLRLTEAISLDTAMHLERAIDLVVGEGDLPPERIERETALLGLSIAAADRAFHAQLDDLYADLHAHAALGREVLPAPPPKRPEKLRALLKRAAQHAAIGTLVAATAGCDGCGTTVDPAPVDAGELVVDPPPPDAGMDAGELVVDPPPPDAGMLDAGAEEDAGPDAGGLVVDPPPPDAGMSMVLPDDATEDTPPRRLPLIDQWRDSSPKRSIRTRDLPLAEPPSVHLAAVPEGDAYRVSIVGGPDSVGTRWDARGAVVGNGREVVWKPGDAEDQISVAVRARRGVAIVSLRASDLA